MHSDLNTQPYKAILGFVVAFAGTLVASLQGRTDLDTMGWQQWLVVVLSSLATAYVVWQTPNPVKVPPAIKAARKRGV